MCLGYKKNQTSGKIYSEEANHHFQQTLAQIGHVSVKVYCMIIVTTANENSGTRVSRSKPLKNTYRKEIMLTLSKPVAVASLVNRAKIG